MPWVELVKSWHDTSVDACDVCGNLLINSYWEFDTADGATMRACREDDEELHAWLARHKTGKGSLFPDAPPGTAV